MNSAESGVGAFAASKWSVYITPFAASPASFLRSPGSAIPSPPITGALTPAALSCLKKRPSSGAYIGV